MQSLFSGFKDFIMRGNVLELAVAVVIGTAFTALVNGIVEGLLNPLVALVAGRRDLSQVGAFSVNDTTFLPGLAIDALITFLLVSAAVYFFIKLPLSKLAALRVEDEVAAQAAPTLAPDVVLLQEIRDLLAAGAAERVGSPTASSGAATATGGTSTGATSTGGTSTSATSTGVTSTGPTATGTATTGTAATGAAPAGSSSSGADRPDGPADPARRA